jgi:serine/threonine protein kinase/tetratricopeptide (TPR) repeat protein
MPNDVPILYGKYQLLEQLARGGMAEVYKAKAHGVEGFEKILVIKRILPELSQNPRFVSMFIDEAKIAVTLSHANIVQVFDLGLAEGTYFIAMEYVAGMDLAAMLRRSNKAKRLLAPELAVYLISELAKGLDYLHRRRDAEMRPLNIVHRDVSPQNVLLSFEGEVKLTDFGIAKARSVAQAVTEVGVIKGKYAYMSPEQLVGQKLDARTDIFSAGTLLYEALSGQNPFQAASSYDTLQRIRKGAVAPIEELVPELPEEIGRIVRRAMAAHLDERYQSAGELYEDLIQYLYTTGRRVSARDLVDHLAALRSSSDDTGRGGDRLEAVFEVTAFDEPMPERTRVERGRRPRLEPSATTPAATPSALTSRERTEWRDVTALAVRLEQADAMRDETLAHLVERFGGSVARELLPNAAPGQRLLLALFGEIDPDGRDADNAARCALRLARAASAAAAEAGAATTAAIAVCAGRVLIDLSGTLLKDGSYASLLEGACKLASATGDGQILVDAACEKALRSRFRLVSAGRQADDAHLLASERGMGEAQGRFIGRRTELRKVGEALARAHQGKLQIIGLHGEAGSGKSRLLSETMRRLGLAGHSVGLHVATLTPQMREAPLSAIQEMLRAVLGVDEFDPEALVRGRTTRLRELGLLSVEQGAVAATLGLQRDAPRHTGHRPLKAALLRIVRKLAEDQLTIFAFDGAEHMDPDSLSIVEDMLRAVSRARIGVFLCYRPGYEPRWADLENFTEVRLAPMSDEDIARLVATRLGADEMPFDLLREVTTKSGGNPLYVEEYLKALQSAGTVSFDEGQVRYNRDAGGVDMPKTLRGIVASRIAKLDPTQRYLLQVASMVGERFHADIIAAAAQEDIRIVTESLQSKEMRGIVTSRGPSEHMFSHGLVQQVLVESVTLQARKEIHAAIADAIVRLHPDRIDEMAERLARHHQEAGNDEQAVGYLLRAADRLEDEGALEGVILELRRAIDILATGDPKHRLLMLEQYERLAELCFRNRNLTEGTELMERGLKAAETARSQHHAARFCMWRGRMLVGASRIEEGRRWLDQAQHIARGLTDWELSRDVFLATSDAEARGGEFEKAVGFLREALQLSREAGDRASELRCLTPLALTYARMGDRSSALSTLEQAKRFGDERSDAATSSQLHRLESQIHYHARDQEASARAAAKALELAREAGLHHEAALNAHNMGEAFLRLGDHRRAFAALRSSYEVAIENGYARLQMSNIRALGFIDATRFGSSEGRARVLQAIDYAEKHDFVWDVIQGKYFLAIIEQKRGDIEAARSRLREVLNLAAQHGHRNYIEDAESALRRIDAGQGIDLQQ